MAEKPFEGVGQAEEAGYADDLRHFRWSNHGPEEWAGLLLLWVLGALVFTQFFTRYVLNDSLAWSPARSPANRRGSSHVRPRRGRDGTPRDRRNPGRGPGVPTPTDQPEEPPV